MKRIAVIISAAAMVFATAGLAHASASFTDGGYSTTSADSSSCGGNWAQDLNVRNFTVQLPAVSPGVYKVTEKFANGHFSTIKGTSPGACNTGPDNGNKIKGGVQGTWSGSYSLTVSGGVLDVDSACDLTPASTTDSSNEQCFTDGWISGFFGSGATYTLDNWAFTYNAKHIAKHHWVNACTVADTGAGCTHTGNSGDIASTLGS